MKRDMILPLIHPKMMTKDTLPGTKSEGRTGVDQGVQRSQDHLHIIDVIKVETTESMRE